MPPFLKLAVFWLLLMGCIGLLFRFSDTRIAGVLFTWHGPEPTEGETLSHYYLRRCLWVLMLFCQAAALLWLLIGSIQHWPQLQGGPVEFIGMLLPPIGLLLLIAALRYALLSAKAKWLGPNPVYERPDPVVEA